MQPLTPQTEPREPPTTLLGFCLFRCGHKSWNTPRTAVFKIYPVGALMYLTQMVRAQLLGIMLRYEMIVGEPLTRPRGHCWPLQHPKYAQILTYSGPHSGGRDSQHKPAPQRALVSHNFYKKTAERTQIRQTRQKTSPGGPPVRRSISL